MQPLESQDKGDVSGVSPAPPHTFCLLKPVPTRPRTPMPLNLLYSLNQATLMVKFTALLNSWCSQINSRFPHSQQVILPSQDPLHYQTHHEIPHRHSLTLAREPLVSDAVPSTNCPDLSPSAGQTNCRTAVTAGLSWLLGAEGSQILFPAQDLPSPHPLCCLPVQPTHCLCCNHATDTPLLPVMYPQGTVRAPQHAPSLW